MAMSLVKVVAGLRVVAALGLVVAGMAAQGAGPSARYSHHMAYDSVRGKVVLFGGTQQPGSVGLQDTWEWDGRMWNQLAPNASPLPTWAGAMCFDAQRGECILFGGYSNTAGADLNTTWAWDGLAWSSKTTTSTPPARRHQAMCYDAQRGVIVMAGGVTTNTSPATTYSDTWEWNGTNWTARVSSPSPSGTANAALAYDSQRNKCVLLATTGETWTLEATGWQQVITANTPPLRSTAACWFDTSIGRMVLHGGTTPNGTPLNDTWSFDGINWTPIVNATAPSNRYWTNFGGVYCGAKGALLFGGWTGSAALSDTWTFSGGNWRQRIAYIRSPLNGHLYGVTAIMHWSQAEAIALQESGHLATIRNAAEHNWIVSTFGSPGLWIGLNDIANEGIYTWSSGEPANYRNWAVGQPNGFPQEDVCCLWQPFSYQWADADDLTFTMAGVVELQPPTATITATSLPTTAAPPATSFHTLAPTPTGSALLFGGNTTTLPHTHTYTLTGTSWSKEFSILNPMARTDATLLLDPARINNVLFGGRNAAGTALGDTWTWAAGQWTYLTPATAPAPRHGHRMAFDRVANVGLLFGGKDATGAELSDFWSWNGTTWAQLTPATLPPARANHGMAYDDLRNRTVVFGGKSGSSRLSDVWEWDGTAWTNLTPQGTPAWGPDARDGHAMAYDPRAERVVLHGGETASGCQQDVWSWNGTEWTIHLAQSGSVPSARTGSQLIHENGTNRMLLFAGGCGTSYTNDLWQLSLPTFARATSYGSPCIGSRGPLTLSAINNSAPVIGQTFQMEMSNVPTFSPCAGLLGLSNTELNGIPLPFDLAFLSMPGCNAYMSKDLNFQLPPPNNILNTTAWDLAIPLDSVFLGLHIYMQGLALEFGGSRFATVTNGVDARIGDR
jgi:hypothetical protein